MNYSIVANGTSKTYGEKIALKNVSFSIKKGEIFSLLGRNGAGKTTFIRIASGQLMPTSGTVVVGGHDVVKDVEKVREKIAIVPQDARIIRSASAKEFVMLYLTMRESDSSVVEKHAMDAIKEVGLMGQENLPARFLSGGNRHRLLLACVIASNAPILFLDEPSIGLDAEARRELWTTLLALKKSGKTIVLTTHYMDEAEVLSDRLAIIDKGSVVKIGSPKQIIEETGYQLRVDVDKEQLKKLKVPRGVDSYSFGHKQRLIGKTKAIEAIASQAVKKRLEVSVGRASLEDAFIKIVGIEKSSDNGGPGGW